MRGRKNYFSLISYLNAIFASDKRLSRIAAKRVYTVNSKEHLTRGEDSFYLDLTGYSTRSVFVPG